MAISDMSKGPALRFTGHSSHLFQTCLALSQKTREWLWF